MKVLILGFAAVDEIDSVMQKLIIEKQCFLFYVLCGGLDMEEHIDTPASIWAKKNGAPLLWIKAASAEQLIKKLEKETDYIVMKLTDATPQWQKNLMMRLKGAGKHGTVVR